MQVLPFSTGGFAVHAITSLSASKISAWFDATGALIDAEYPTLGRAVAATGPVRDGLVRLGQRLAAGLAAGAR